jgi:WD40 repeat protein
LTLPGAHTTDLSYTAFSPDGTRLATAAFDRVARIWDSRTGEELLTLSGHSNAVNSVVYSRDGTRIATASADGTARIWDAATGEELLAISTHPIGVGRAVFDKDGTRLITANWDNTVRVYVLSIEELMALARSRVTRSLTREECQRYLHTDECPALP